MNEHKQTGSEFGQVGERMQGASGQGRGAPRTPQSDSSFGQQTQARRGGEGDAGQGYPGHGGYGPRPDPYYPPYPPPYAAQHAAYYPPGYGYGYGHAMPYPPGHAPADPTMGAPAGQRHGMSEVMEEIASGGNGLSSLTKMLDFDDKDFWKGALVGAAVVLLLTNETVQRTLFRGAVKGRDAMQEGADKLKEGVDKVKDTLSGAQENSDE